MNGLGERLRNGFDDAFARNGIRGQATGLGSLANIHLTDAKLVERARRAGRRSALRPHQSAAAPRDADARRREREPPDVLHVAPMTVDRCRLRDRCARRCAANAQAWNRTRTEGVAVVTDAIKLISGTSHPALAAEIAQHLGVPLCETEIHRFGNENILFQCKENVRESDVFVIQTSCPPVSDLLDRTADHHRRAQARVGAPHHRGAAVPAVCAFRQERPAAHIDHRATGGGSARNRRRASRADDEPAFAAGTRFLPHPGRSAQCDADRVRSPARDDAPR